MLGTQSLLTISLVYHSRLEAKVQFLYLWENRPNLCMQSIALIPLMPMTGLTCI